MVGFDAKNKHILDPKFICPVCSLILHDPVQLNSCGHRQCQSCFDTQPGTTLRCPQCKIETQRNQVLLDRGFKNNMQSLPVDCSFCQWADVLRNYQEHLDQSHPDPKCEHCNEQFNTVDELNQHKVSKCQKVLICCILKDFGCKQQIMRGKMTEHYLTQQHQESIIEVVCQECLRMGTDPSQITSVTTSDPPITQLQELYETRNILIGEIEALNDDGQRLSNELCQYQIRLQTLASDLLPLKTGVQESNNSLEESVLNQTDVSQQPTITNETIDNTQCTSYDGTFVWKITNPQEKMADAQSGRQTSIYSPPFYSSPTGYKMRLCLYLHGDGNACRTHISLFFVLMRGEYDAILQFPFNFKVTFCLYDQTGAQRHIIDSFRPDIKSNSFQRPRSQMNIASGIPKFFPLAMIHQENNPYVRDDTMFIKVMVDFGGLSKTMLPYAVSLNPGLPTYIQQNMIKQEIERRAQQSSASSPAH